MTETAYNPEETSTPVEITAAQLHAARRAIASMPYGAMVTMSPVARSAETLVDDLIDYLTGLGNVLRMVGDRNRAIESDRDELLRQRDAVRSFLGIQS